MGNGERRILAPHFWLDTSFHKGHIAIKNYFAIFRGKIEIKAIEVANFWSSREEFLKKKATLKESATWESKKQNKF